MKKTLPLIVAGFLLFAFKADNIKNSLTLSNLKGKVRSVTESVYMVQTKLGIVDKGKLINTDSSAYNEKGNIMQWRRFNSNGLLIALNNNNYNEQDKLCEENAQLNNKLFKDTSLYDAGGKRVEEDIFKQGNRLVSKYTFKYEGDNMTEEAIYSHNKLISKHSYSYNDNGIIFLENDYNSSGNVVTKVAYSYNDTGDIIGIETYDVHGKLKYKTTIKYDDYDETGNWIKCTKFYNSKAVSITERAIAYY